MENTALLIVDVQNALVKDNPFKIEDVLNNINKLSDICRAEAVEVIYVQHDDEVGEELEPFTEGWEISQAVAPKSGEKVFRKTYNSAFKNTNLEAYLISKHIETLILVGMQTQYCIDTTCRVAFEKGYKLIMPEYTNTTVDNDLFKAEQIYEYHNHKIFKNRFAEVLPLNEFISRI